MRITDRNINKQIYYPYGLQWYSGFKQQDMPIAMKVISIATDEGISTWAALQKIPDQDIPGHGRLTIGESASLDGYPRLKNPEKS